MSVVETIKLPLNYVVADGLINLTAGQYTTYNAMSHEQKQTYIAEYRRRTTLRDTHSIKQLDAKVKQLECEMAVMRSSLTAQQLENLRLQRLLKPKSKRKSPLDVNIGITHIPQVIKRKPEPSTSPLDVPLNNY